MKKEWADKWVEALRSGKYKKGKGRLKDGQGRMCCLGVLCDISNTLGFGGRALEASGTVSRETKYTTGLKTINGFISASGGYNLAVLNDDLGYTFDEIADIIQLCWEDL